MGMEVLEINTSGELVLWLHLAESEVNIEQDGAEIILDYMAEHGMTLAVRKQELAVLDAGEEYPEYKPYSIDDAIHDVCEWNLELIQDEMVKHFCNTTTEQISLLRIPFFKWCHISI